MRIPQVILLTSFLSFDLFPLSGGHIVILIILSYKEMNISIQEVQVAYQFIYLFICLYLLFNL